ncbi:MAG: PilZ domain-containing protein [Desulfovibrio sp.]
MDISIDVPDKGQRGAFRCRIPGLLVRVRETGKVYHVEDISASGFAFKADIKKFKEDADLTIDLFLSKKPIVAGVVTRVIRLIAPKQLVGCSFDSITQKQEEKLDKLVLEVQKRMIAMRKTGQEEGEA